MARRAGGANRTVAPPRYTTLRLDGEEDLPIDEKASERSRNRPTGPALPGHLHTLSGGEYLPFGRPSQGEVGDRVADDRAHQVACGPAPGAEEEPGRQHCEEEERRVGENVADSEDQ